MFLLFSSLVVMTTAAPSFFCRSPESRRGEKNLFMNENFTHRREKKETKILR
jgi:hypothetical protein